MATLTITTILTVVVFVVQAANTTNNFTGGSTASLLSTANWSLGHLPAVSEDAVFIANAGIHPLNGGNLTVGSFNVTASSGTFSIRNEINGPTNSTLTLGGAGDQGNGVSGTAGDLLYAAGGSTFNILGPNVNAGSGVLNLVLGQSGSFDAAGTISVSSVISDGGGNFGIIKSGNGSLTLSGANTYGGGTTLSAGTLKINNSGTSSTNSALGTGTFTINGGTISNDSGSSVNLATNNTQTWGGDFAFAGTSGTNDLNLGTGAVTLTGNRAVTVNGTTSSLTVGGAIGDGGSGFSLTKATGGAGTLILTGANTYTGTTAVSAGTLKLNRSGGGTLPSSNSVTINGGSLQISSNQTISGLTMSSGTLTVDSGVTLTITGTYNVSGGTINNQGTIKLNGGSVSFPGTGATVNNGATNTMSNLEIAVSGTVTLTGSIIVSGSLTVTSGVFDQGTSFNLTAGTISVAGGATLKNLGTGDLTIGAGGVSNAGTINYNSGGASCPNADNILIRSTTTGTRRSWSGAGTFSMTDVDVQDQGGTAPIVATSSTNSGNNGANWIITSSCTAGNTYQWIGPAAGNTDWINPVNWSPTRATAAISTSDVLLINTGSSPLITNVPTQTIAALRILNSGGNPTNLTLRAATGGSTLTISGATGSDLQIDSGSSATLDGSDALRLDVAGGSKGNVYGQIIVQGGAHRVTGEAANIITFQSGALFTTGTGFTGNAFGTGATGDGANGSIIFANGSYYFHNAGSSPFGPSPNAVITFQTGSEADYLTATGFDAGGRTYANLVIGDSNTAVNAGASGTGNFQFDNLTVNSTSTSNSSLTYTGSGASAVTIQGDITSAGAGTGAAVSDVSLTAGTGGIVLNKSGTQTFSTASGRTVTFGGDASVGGSTTLALSRNLIVSSGTLNIASGGSLTGSSSGYVLGAVKKSSLSGSFTFPVGTSVGYTPLVVANATGGGDLTVKPTASVQPNVNASTSLKEYWTLTAAGSLTLDMTFNYQQADVQGDESSYRVIRVSNGTAVSFPPNCPTICVDATNNTATIKNVSSFSDWTLGQPVAPTAVEFGAARAESYAEGVLVTWDSGREVNNLGFNVYREAGGRRVRLNRGVVAGSALTFGAGVEARAGESYRWFDAGATGAALYWIEDIDLDGTRTLHGPFVPVVGQGDGRKIAREYAQALTLDDLNAKALNEAGVFVTGGAAAQTVRGAEVPSSILAPRKGGLKESSADDVRRQWEIAAGAAVKIGVKRDGWYRVTREELIAAGLDASADARMLQLFADGRQVPLRLRDAQGVLGPNGSIEFYGRGLDTATADTRVYYLVVGSQPGLRIQPPTAKLAGAGQKSFGPFGVAADAKNDGAARANAPGTSSASDASSSSNASAVSSASLASPQGFAYTFERRERLLYFSSLLNGDAENYFGQLVGTQPANETLTASHLASGDGAQLEVALQGVTSGAHLVALSLNGTEVGRLGFNALEHPRQTFALPASLLREGDNALKLSVVGTGSDLSLVDYVRLTYSHAYAADGNALRFTVPAKGGALIDGFTAPNVRVFDVTDPEAVAELPAQISATNSGYAARVQAAGGHTLLALTDDLVGRAASVTANAPSDWHDEGRAADMVIVTHSSLRESVAPLKALRESQGMRVEVVDVEDLYDEFSFGAHTPQAIKDFLSWTYGNWRQSPRYVLFAGDATIDPRDYEGRGAFDLVPTKLIDTSSMEAPSDEWFADFDGGGVAVMALGRLPVRTPQDAASVVSKIVNFSPTAAGAAALLVSDRSGTNDLDFASASRAVASQLPAGTATTYVGRNDGTPDAVRAQIVAAINAGPMAVNFMGHGSTARWTGDDLLRTADAAALTNGDRLPLFTMMTCLNGYFVGTVSDSLAESALKARQGGAVAVWASSGTTVPVDQQTVGRELYRLVFSSGQSPALGDAVRQSKLLTQDQDIRRTWILFGDPSMRVR